MSLDNPTTKTLTLSPDQIRNSIKILSEEMDIVKAPLGMEEYRHGMQDVLANTIPQEVIKREVGIALQKVANAITRYKEFKSHIDESHTEIVALVDENIRFSEELVQALNDFEENSDNTQTVEHFRELSITATLVALRSLKLKMVLRS